MIKEPFLISMRNDPEIRQKLAKANEVAPTTIQGWLKRKDPLLTTAVSLAVMKQHFGLLESFELLEPQSELATKE